MPMALAEPRSAAFWIQSKPAFSSLAVPKPFRRHRPQLTMPPEWPASAEALNHLAAASAFLGAPLPVSDMTPRLYIAAPLPCCAAVVQSRAAAAKSPRAKASRALITRS